jgi:hypothetical protein
MGCPQRWRELASSGTGQWNAEVRAEQLMERACSSMSIVIIQPLYRTCNNTCR